MRSVVLQFFDMTREWTIIVAAIALIYYHNALVFYIIFGACACTFLAKILKFFIKQQRPVSGTRKRKSYGMPSTHSAAIMYFSTIICHLIHDHTNNSLRDKIESHHSKTKEQSINVLATTLICSIGLSAALSRALNGYHSISQVFAGICLGVTFATVWWHYHGVALPFIERLTVYYLDAYLGICVSSTSG
ncbi:PAP2 superfamily-domain-containing protein [Coemansia spiralis]|nr:PAP2 superfamily-domain-containing protein [Coemansia spiralis]